MSTTSLLRIFRRSSFTTFIAGSLVVACGGESDTVPSSSGDGDGDGDAAPGDGDGTVGDGDSAIGDGDGTTGDGDGVIGDGDGTAGDGDSAAMGDRTSQINDSRFGGAIAGGSTQSGYETIPLTVGGNAYNVLTNPWGGAEQTITAGGGSIFTVTSISHPSGGNPWDVASFPSVYRGGNNQGVWTENSGMPIAISELNSVRTGLKTNSRSVTYDGNTTYDVYFTNSGTPIASGPDIYLMVWFHSHALNPINGETEMWNCDADPPLHINACTEQGSVMVGDRVFHRFIGSNGHADVISYAPETNFGEWEFDLKDFIDDAVAQGVLSPAMYLQSVQAGFELADGGAGLTVQDFYADIE